MSSNLSHSKVEMHRIHRLEDQSRLTKIELIKMLLKLTETQKKLLKSLRIPIRPRSMTFSDGRKSFCKGKQIDSKSSRDRRKANSATHPSSQLRVANWLTAVPH